MLKFFSGDDVLVICVSDILITPILAQNTTYSGCLLDLITIYSFIKILNENTQTSLFYNNSKEDSTLKNALEKIEVLKK